MTKAGFRFQPHVALRERRRKQGQAALESDTVARFMATSLGYELENQTARRRVEELLANPLFERPEFFQSMLQWLTENPTRGLSPRMEEILSRVENALVIQKRTGVRTHGKTRPRLSRARTTRADERPAWMNDAAMLPKRPPGK